MPAIELPKATLELGGVRYILQHPGNRAWVRAYKGFLKGGEFDMEAFMDWAFENVVFLEKGGKVTLDTVSLQESMDWSAILQAFLIRGVLDGDYGWTDADDRFVKIMPAGESEKTGVGSGAGDDVVAPGAEGAGNDRAGRSDVDAGAAADTRADQGVRTTGGAATKKGDIRRGKD